MAAGQGVTDYITIDDFTPGIVDDYASISGSDQSPGKDGAARISDTYGCLAGPRGGLVPAWGIADSITQNLIDTAGRYHSAHPYMRVIATCNMSPIHRKGPDSPVIMTGAAGSGWNLAYSDSPTTPDHLFVMYQMFYDNTGSGDWRHRVAVVGYKRFKSSPDTHTPVNFTSPMSISSLHADHVRFGFGAMFGYRQSTDYPDDPTFAGMPLLWMGHAVTASKIASYLGPGCKRYMWPKDPFSFANVDDASTALLGHNFALALEHQGRVVEIQRSFYGVTDGGDFGGNNSYGQPFGADGVFENVEHSYVNEFNAGAVDAVDIGTTQFSAGDPFGIAVAHSLSANELLLVKQRGGALLVRGDIANPTVIKLGSMPDVRGAANIGAQTPLGFVFGTRGGVYLYPGGDRAQCISPNLEGWFWQPTSMTRLLNPQPYGQFAWFDPYLIAPNNWCWDSRTGAWMRYYPTPTLAGAGNGGRIFPFIETSAADHFYALNAGVSNSNATEEYPNQVASRFSTTATMPAWSWRSQPLVRTRGRRINVREVQILAQALDGPETVAVTVYGYGPGSSYSEVLGSYTFNVPDASRPVQLTHPFKCTGGDVEVKIVTSGPVNLYRLSIGYNEGPTAHV